MATVSILIFEYLTLVCNTRVQIYNTKLKNCISFDKIKKIKWGNLSVLIRGKNFREKSGTLSTNEMHIHKWDAF